MIDRHILRLEPGARDKAVAGISAAIRKFQPGKAWILEIREPNRSDEQNAALHGLIGQIIKQRPIHNGIRMDMALWKASFMQALGEEVRFVSTLDGDGVFPIGLSTKALNKGRFSELIEFVLSWCAKEGLDVKHFDEEPNAS